MNKKIKQYSALAIATAAVLPMACKEEKEINSEDIIDIAINKVVTGVGTATDFEKIDSIDINNDDVFDFELSTAAGIYDGTSYAYTGISGKNISNNILTNNVVILGETLKIPIAKNSGDKINSSSTNWTKDAEVGLIYLGEEAGFAGDGDKFYGFKFSASDGIHYGWMKVNLTADYKTLTIKELAYHKTPNTEIAVGSK
jgi:hypothetical protein